MKTCKKCKQSKPDSEFYKEPRVKDGLTARCKACMKADAATCYWKDPEHHKARVRANYDYAKRRERTLKENYGINAEDYQEMFEKQAGVCRICGSADSKHNVTEHLLVDHCHHSGKVRGLLCAHCNFLIGHAQDSIDTLLNAAWYLKLSQPA